MGITRDTVATALCHCLDIEQDVAGGIAGEMTRHELMQVLNARRRLDGIELVGELVPLALQVEMRAIDESDEGAVCEVIDRARTRMQMAEACETNCGNSPNRRNRYFLAMSPGGP